MKPFRTAAALVASLLLGSCTFQYSVKAFFLDGHLAFVSEDVGLDPLHCTNMIKVLDGQGRIVWEIQPRRWSQGSRCKPNSPMKYGAVPTGIDAIHAAEKLRTGTIYVIDGGSGGDRILGAFALYRGGGKLVVRNLPTDSDEVDAMLGEANRASLIAPSSTQVN